MTISEELSCADEEADTWIIVHLTDFDRRCSGATLKGRVIIKSDDTDVVVLAVRFFQHLTAVHDL